MLRKTLFSLIIAASLSIAVGANADCAQGSNYSPLVNGNTVTVTLSQTQRKCPDASGMLRQNLATGEVDLLAGFCGTGDFGASAYIDECVPPGTYRYGLALPYDCSEAGCGGVELFHDVTVTAAFDPLHPCMRTSGDPGPTVTNEAPPWGTGAEVDNIKSCPHAGCFCSTTSATVVSMNAGAFALGALALVVARRRRR